MREAHTWCIGIGGSNRGSIIFKSKPLLQASRVCGKCHCLCNNVKNPYWELFVKKEIYFILKLVF